MISNDDETVNALDEMFGPTRSETDDILGADAGGGFNWGTLINAAAEAANQGVNYAEQQKAQQKAGREADAAAIKARSADAAWASAEQQYELAQKSGDQGRIGPAQALQVQAMQAAQKAGMGLNPQAQAARTDAAQKALSEAASGALGSPNDAGKQAYLHAWQKVTLSSGGSGDGGGGGGVLAHINRGGGGGENWLTKMHAGAPTYVWIGGAAVGVTALILILRALLSRGGRK